MVEDSTNRTYLVGGEVIRARSFEPAIYLVATPIGNLGDITLRAIETLAGADILACEDTRVTRILLERYGISRRMFAYHEHNEQAAAQKLIDAVNEGKSVALCSDAGTPLISDPGYRLVSTAREAGVKVVPLPGPSALLAALSASGLPSDAFFFAGFLPNKASQRKTRLDQLAHIPGTLIFYESPRRLPQSLAAMAEVLGESRRAVVARELTKTFEEFRSAPLGELAAHYAEAESIRGEIVVCIEPPLQEEIAGEADIDRMLRDLAGQMSTSKAAGEVAKMTGLQKADLYKRLLELKDD
ncbi:16S rRNA (cytidine(1402)-2'-O)-methyltransferase [Limoniibacter endophyticus]|uniref:Ribosomal RNA small subunit methyltransferase I n=1 Tax=Limoniibacter endophyticus TaxID=1565040 RepID=A0A8J3DLK9_9HYPH|nr:16S rRNA (cytidine(1402)-2'-O)-methyltransferase [Limoniibacter endophyticus]GHC80686.1 ribosomal RNA small subunit methyltransferase I [Limoniibacter endophyticus]